MSATGIHDVANVDRDPAHSAVRSYEEEQRTIRRRRRTVRFAVCVPLWALGVLPLAREIAESGGVDVVLAYVAVAASSLAIAAALRGVYALLVKGRLLAPVVFVIAAVLALATYGVRTAGEPVPPVASATPELRQAV